MFLKCYYFHCKKRLFLRWKWFIFYVKRGTFQTFFLFKPLRCRWYDLIILSDRSSGWENRESSPNISAKCFTYSESCSYIQLFRIHNPSEKWNSHELFQALEQVVPGLGIPPKEALEWSIEGISVESTWNSHRKCLTFTSKSDFFRVEKWLNSSRLNEANGSFGVMK